MSDPEKHLPLHMRPAFLNSGFIVGPAQDLKTLMGRVLARSQQRDDHQGSDQHIFNEIYGEQEYHPEVGRQRHRSAYYKTSNLFRSALGLSGALVTDKHPEHKPMDVVEGPFEYGIGLDYGLELSQSAVLSEFDGRFLTFDDELAMKQTLESPGFPQPPRVTRLPDDLARDDAPWSQRPLYTNVWTSSIPVTLHMNGFKTIRQAIWGEMWLFKTAQAMLQPRLSKIATDEVGNPSWADACGAYEGELFGPPEGKPANSICNFGSFGQ